MSNKSPNLSLLRKHGCVINLARGSATASSFSGMKAMLKSIGVLATARVRLPLRTVSAEEESRIAVATAEFRLQGLD